MRNTRKLPEPDPRDVQILELEEELFQVARILFLTRSPKKAIRELTLIKLRHQDPEVGSIIDGYINVFKYIRKVKT